MEECKKKERERKNDEKHWNDHSFSLIIHTLSLGLEQENIEL